MTLDSGAINNAGNVIADGALSLNGDYQGAGLLHTADTLTLRGNQLRNSGRWESRAPLLNGGRSAMAARLSVSAASRWSCVTA
nr:hypothetical protein KXZ65_00715 [Pectobacterium sp. PL152]